MNIEIEQIKALDPNKIYVVEFDLSKGPEKAEALSEALSKAAREFGLRFIFTAKGIVEFISLPEGLEVVKK